MHVLLRTMPCSGALHKPNLNAYVVYTLVGALLVLMGVHHVLDLVHDC
jgi:uncharacterized membrane protein HdeD (DUF308 family)